MNILFLARQTKANYSPSPWTCNTTLFGEILKAGTFDFINYYIIIDLEFDFLYEGFAIQPFAVEVLVELLCCKIPI